MPLHAHPEPNIGRITAERNDVLRYDQNIRAMISDENNLINHRMTWLTTLNGLLFTGLSFVWGKSDSRYIILTLSIIGLMISFFCGLALWYATMALNQKYDWWETHKPLDYDGPDVMGFPPIKTKSPLKNLTAWVIISIIFVAGWASIITNIIII